MQVGAYYSRRNNRPRGRGSWETSRPTPASPGLVTGLDIPSNYPGLTPPRLFAGARLDAQAHIPEAQAGLLFCELGLQPARLPAAAESLLTPPRSLVAERA